MRRRRLVAVVSALILGAIGFVVIATALFVTRTDYGQDEIRSLVRRQLAGAIDGKLYLGHISGTWLTGITIDSLALRGPDDSLFVATGPVHLSYDPRDLIDKRIYLRDVEVEHPVVILHQHEEGEWNYQHIFRKGGPKGPRTPGRKFGDFVVLDSVRVRNGSFRLTLPWHPDDSLRGARRDSAVRHELARTDREIRREREEGKTVFQHTYRWTNLDVAVSRIRLADPDSDRLGRLFVIDSLRVDENDPPFRFRNVRGTLRNLGDSLWIDIPHFDLPRSTGTGKGKVWWGSDLPVRYDIAVRGDSVSLADVAWVYPTLPTTGGGTLDLHIGNDPKSLRVMEYALRNMDVRTTKSRLRGNMTFAVGGPVLAVRDVDMRVEPMDWDLLRVLNGKPFPEDWRGTLTGTVKARGGPLNHFVVDDANVTWNDAHVAGAVSRFSGRGELDILLPAFTAFHAFRADVQRLDLRSIEYLFPNFPRLGGTIAGVATLDSSWLDVRFRDADVTHTDGPAEPSRFTGSGRVTYGLRYMSYDLALQAQPLSLTTLARSYPMMPLKGTLTGPVKLRGTTADLAVSAALSGDAGTLSYDGTLDVDTASYGAHGAGQVTNLDLAALLTKGAPGHTSITGQYAVQLTGDSLANLDGTAAVTLARSEIQGTRIYDARARLRFGNGRLAIDTGRAETVMGTLVAAGALGLPHGPSETLRVSLTLDSLGGLRRWLAPAKPGAEPDSLGGVVQVTATLSGRVDSLDATGAAAVSRLVFATTHADSVAARFTLRDALRSPTGTVAFTLDTLRFGATRFDSIGGELRLAGPTQATFAFGVAARDHVSASVLGSWAASGGVTTVTLRELSILADTNRWSLATPATFVRDSTALAVDSLVLRDRADGRIVARGFFPDDAPVSGQLHADRVRIADIGALIQSSSPLDGRAALDVVVGGTRARPTITVGSRIDSLAVGSMRIERVTSRGDYHDRRLGVSLDLLRKEVPVVRATAVLPVEVTLFGATLLGDSLRGSARADSADLAIVEAFSPQLTNGAGKFDAQLQLAGTWERPTLGGQLTIPYGGVDVKTLGIRLEGLQADVALVPGKDSLAIRRLRAWSGANPADSVSLTGGVEFTNREDPRLGLRLYARTFRAIDKRTVARLDVSTGPDGLRLEGPMTSALLTGTVSVDRGTIFLPDPDLLRKQLVDLTLADSLLGVSDDQRTKILLPQAPSALVQGLRLEGVRIDLGDDVWLRSQAANVKLSGSLNVTTSRDVLRDVSLRSTSPIYRLALQGTLNADRGTYNLDLGLVQREFRVQSGAITFQGTPDNNPMIDITALHNVKRAGQADLGVLVHIHGYLNPYPGIDFASNENYPISETDLVSYLATGKPSFETTQDVQNTVASVLLPTASALLSQKLNLDFQAGTTTNTNGTALNQGFKDVLFSSRLGGEKQLTNSLFVRVSGGLCALRSLQEQGTLDPGLLRGTLSWKLDYRFDPLTSFSLAYEPTTQGVNCGQDQARIISTPQQFGMSLFRTWHF